MRRVKAILRVEAGKRGYHEYPVQAVQSYAIETSMDGDADPFSLDIADPRRKFRFLLDRDTEVMVNIFSGTTVVDMEQLQYGIADEVRYDSSDQILSISGRDFSCVATDSDCPPGEFKHQFPNAIVKGRALDLGFPKVIMPPMSSMAKIYTDGSETEWEFWYRLMRERDMWLWTLPDATLVAGRLGYSLTPTYYFGQPDDIKYPNQSWIPVLIGGLNFRSNKQQRLQEVWMYGETGEDPLFATSLDKTISAWTRRPLKIELNASAKNQAELKKMADDELFDSIVGAVEFTLRVKDTGVKIEQNTMARVNLPKEDLVGTFYIVGVQLTGDEGSGFFQEVRFRQKQYALSRRVPDAPQIVEDTTTNEETDPEAPEDSAANILTTQGVKWAECFVKAAYQWHAGSGKNETGRAINWDWEIAAFLGLLMAICQVETQFRNIRITLEGQKFVAGPEYLQPPDPPTGARMENWQDNYANTKGNPHNPSKIEAGVGPMRLHTRPHKEEADKMGSEVVSDVVPAAEGKFPNWTEVGATWFGGPQDVGTGSTGHVKGVPYDLVKYPDSYAELSTNPTNLADDDDPHTDNDYAALGYLPALYPLQIRNPKTKKIVIGKHRDSGFGQGMEILPGGHRAQIDLWYELANSLGMEGWGGYGMLEIADIGVGEEKTVSTTGSGKIDEYRGTRWDECINIQVAAKVLAQYKGGRYASTDVGNMFLPGGIVDGYSERSNFVTNVKNAFYQKWYQLAKDAIAGPGVGSDPQPVGGKGAFTLCWKEYMTEDGKRKADCMSFPACPPQIQTVVETAIDQLGIPYHFGGGDCTGPTYGAPHEGTIGETGFDCSGLILYCYCTAGIKIAHFTGDQVKQGKKVMLDDIKPGDMVFSEYDSAGVPQHVVMYLTDNQVIASPHTGDYVQIQPLPSEIRDIRRHVLWEEEETTTDIGGKKRVMIQAGHDTGSHGDQPYGHTGESGAAGEQPFTKSVRDAALAYFAKDSRFDAFGGDAWSASAGATVATSDDIDWSGDIFVAVHYDRGTAGSGFFFGMTRGGLDGHTSTQAAACYKLANDIGAKIEDIPGAPPRLTDNQGFGDHDGRDPANATGWGYYAWGSSLRGGTDNVNHLPGFKAAVLIECGKSADGIYLDSKRTEIGKALYEGICSYYGYDPKG